MPLQEALVRLGLTCKVHVPFCFLPGHWIARHPFTYTQNKKNQCLMWRQCFTYNNHVPSCLARHTFCKRRMHGVSLPAAAEVHPYIQILQIYIWNLITAGLPLICLYFEAILGNSQGWF